MKRTILLNLRVNVKIQEVISKQSVKLVIVFGEFSPLFFLKPQNFVRIMLLPIFFVQFWEPPPKTDIVESISTFFTGEISLLHILPVFIFEEHSQTLIYQKNCKNNTKDTDIIKIFVAFVSGIPFFAFILLQEALSLLYL